MVVDESDALDDESLLEDLVVEVEEEELDESVEESEISVRQSPNAHPFPNPGHSPLLLSSLLEVEDDEVELSLELSLSVSLLLLEDVTEEEEENESAMLSPTSAACSMMGFF